MEPRWPVEEPAIGAHAPDEAMLHHVAPLSEQCRHGERQAACQNVRITLDVQPHLSDQINQFPLFVLLAFPSIIERFMIEQPMPKDRVGVGQFAR